MQLAGANARLAQPNRLYQLDDGMGLMRKIALSLTTLVKRLTADANVVASSLYA